MRDSWLRQGAPRGPRTWAQQHRRFRALRVPAEVWESLRHWAAAPDDLDPVLRLVRAIVVSNAVHRAQRKQVQWAAGTARDSYYKVTPDDPGALRPILAIVARVVSDLERLIVWEFEPPIELHELDAKLQPTGRTVRVARLDETIRGAFQTARCALLGVRDNLREATQRERGRKATLVQPFRLSAIGSRQDRPQPVRRRELERLLRDELFRLHPDRETRARAARADAARVAHRILGAIL